MNDIRLLAQATRFASEAFSNQDDLLRGMRVTAVAADMTDDTELLAAGMLIPVIELLPDAEDEIRRLFGQRVLRLARTASVIDTDDMGWQKARLRELNILRAADRDTLTLVLARALSELRTMSVAELSQAPSTLGWYYVSLREALRPKRGTAAFREFSGRIDRLFGRTDSVRML